MLVEYIRLALSNFAVNRMRTFLSVLGILIGVASFIMITTLGQSARANIQSNIASLGVNTINLFPVYNDAAAGRVFTEELAGKIERNVQGVQLVVPIQQGQFNLRYENTTAQYTVVAANEQYPEIYDYQVAAGRFISAEDDQRRALVIVLGAAVAAELFPGGDAVGKYVRAYQRTAQTFLVIGVMEQRSASIGIDFDQSTYIPYESWIWRIQNTSNVGRYAILTAGGADVLEVAGLLQTYIESLTGTSSDFRVFSPSTIAEVSGRVTGILNLFLAGVAAISLVVGGIGIMNIMLVSVAERTKEIGIRKALGASPRVIRGQFLIEAVTLTTVGGLAGILIGVLLSYALTVYVFKVPFVMALLFLVIAFVFSSGVGVFFGYYPASQAARLDPVAALAFE
jgi:ABC-type antimicrobial peptide transport system permease subunit